MTTTIGRPRILSVDPIGVKLRARRDELGLTVRQLADIAGVDASTISRLETGNMPNVAFVVLSRIARGLGISLDELQEVSLAAV